MAVNVDNDCVLLQTDPYTFNLALDVLAILRKRKLLDMQSCKVIEIDNIQSNDEHEDHSYVFGGRRADQRSFRIQCFAQTASSVLRMCMLEAANASPRPKFGRHSQRRNSEIMRRAQPDFGPKFVLCNDERRSREYYSHYDHLYPHFQIEHKLKEVQPNHWMEMPSMVLIFRRNFSEVIEISTTFKALEVKKPRVAIGTFDSYVNVRCIVRSISDPEDDILASLRKIVSGCDFYDKMKMYQKVLESAHYRDNAESDDESESESTKPCDLSYTELPHPEEVEHAATDTQPPGPVKRKMKGTPTDLFEILPTPNDDKVKVIEQLGKVTIK